MSGYNLKEANIAEKLAEEMIKIADQHESECEDDTCFLVFGLIRDCGYQVKKIINNASAGLN